MIENCVPLKCVSLHSKERIGESVSMHFKIGFDFELFDLVRSMPPVPDYNIGE